MTGKFFFAIILVFTGLGVRAQCVFRLTGVVTDADNRQRLSGANVLIREVRKAVSTDEDGRFKVEGLCAGSYNLLITHIGCQPLEAHIHVKEDLRQDFVLPHAQGQLSEVTVVGTANTRGTGISGEIKGRQLEATRGLTLGESLKQVPGVSVLQTGSNIYKPVIHGLHSNRVLILNNGIRQEGQQWGSEHAPEVDPYIANRLTVIKGASSLRYGADAIGGVVLVEPRLLPVNPGIYGEINSAFFSNGRQGVISGIVEGNARKIPAFSWRLQGTLKKGGDAKTPDYWLVNSGVEEYNFSVAAGLQNAHRGVEVFYSQFNTKLGIFKGAHIGNVTDLQNIIDRQEPSPEIKNASFSYSIDRPYQEVHHQLLKIRSYLATGNAGKLNLVLSGQYNNRMEFDMRKFQSSSNVPQLDLGINTGNADLVWDHNSWKGLRGTIGATASLQKNESYKQRLFIPNYRAYNAGVFLIEKWSHAKWILEGGLRYDIRSIYDVSDNQAGVYDDRYFSSMSGSAGFTYRWRDDLKTTLNFSSAWRAPQVNELYSDGLHHSSARVEKGNPTLQPERANSWLLNFLYNPSKWDIDLGFYYKDINDFIYLAPTYPPVLTIRGAFPAFEYRQTNARLTGLDLSAGYAITAHWKAAVKASLLRAWDKQADDWLIQMPADRYEAELQYDFGNGKKLQDSYVKINLQQVMKQTRVPDSGNIEKQLPDGTITLQPDYAPPPGAYLLTNAEAGTKLMMGRQPLFLVLSVNNLFDVAYRDYMNAFRYYALDMGRNIGLRVKIPLGVKKQ
ncbi:hypothetical protein OI18_20655 [Flavihumibacter solisilvae]|uniref:TonB-dependent receptor n=1 Tax=Flavihumibacter solisilvae TaxID=1349421 RepID=A0A0C1IR03_9BACT|nr:hypothetical protein OI18_20655 [Flavihumibacter solisilvae]